MAAAQQLNRAGHTVTVFERDDEVGGLLRYGIPNFKMEKGIIDRRIEILKAEGIIFKTNINVGVNYACLLYTSPSPRDRQKSRMPSSA